MAALEPETNVALGQRQGTACLSMTIHNAYRHRERENRGRLQTAQCGRWSADQVRVNRHVQDTDIYGASVVAV